jgi:flagellar biosynthetic protein FlhB
MATAYGLIGTAIFIAIGGDAWVLRGMTRTFALVPLTRAPQIASLAAGAQQAFSSIFIAAIVVAAPAMLALLITDVAFGMVSRVVPQLNVFGVGFPVKVGVALLIVGAALPFMGSWMSGQLTDLNGALVLVAGVLALSALGPAVVQGAANAMRQIFALVATPAASTSGAGLSTLEQLVMNTMLSTVAPIVGVCAAVGLVANVAQVGFRPSFGALKPSFSRISPVSGARNLFGTRGLFETVKSLLKVGVVGGLAFTALAPKLTNLGASVGTPPAALGALLKDNVLGIAQRVAIGYVLIGIADMIFQRRRLAKSLRMTKQEVKDESRQSDLSPEIRGAIRRRQMQAARARMMAAVPQADVVVTNPTHYAVALSYDGAQPAPVVVAKGQDHIAMQIRRIAQEHDVPIVPDPPLARSLHASVELGQMIPAELYAAVAQVLAFVYRLASRKKAVAR